MIYGCGSKVWRQINGAPGPLARQAPAGTAIHERRGPRLWTVCLSSSFSEVVDFTQIRQIDPRYKSKSEVRNMRSLLEKMLFLKENYKYDPYECMYSYFLHCSFP